jgi:tetratricopeptide (TPR) repeat protein
VQSYKKTMQNNRSANLLKMLEISPEDPFLHYALGLEYEAAGDDIKAREKFDYLLTNHPDYLPLYYQFGLMLSRLGEHDKALWVLQKGIDLALERKEMKTLGELRQAFEDVEDEE